MTSTVTLRKRYQQQVEVNNLLSDRLRQTRASTGTLVRDLGARIGVLEGLLKENGIQIPD